MIGFAADDKYRCKKDVAYADVYHGANRYSVGTAAAVPICLPRSIMWSFAKQRPLLGREMLRLQGMSFAADDIDGEYSEHQLSDLAGNAFLTWIPAKSWILNLNWIQFCCWLALRFSFSHREPHESQLSLLVLHLRFSGNVILAVVFSILTSIQYYTDAEVKENDLMLDMVQGLVSFDKQRSENAI